MLTFLEVFKALNKQYANKLPFVVYSRPINNSIKCWLQKNDTVFTTANFTESGFVFAPFQLNNDAVLIPKNQSEYFEVDVENDRDFEVDIEHDSEVAKYFDINKTHHTNLITKGITNIKNGVLKKVVLSRLQKHQLYNFNPIETFKKLFNTYKNAMVYCWYHPKVGLWLGATPELLFKIEGRKLTTISLAGTKAYNANSSAKWTNKELDEQQIVTNYLENQIKPFSVKTNIDNVETVRAGNLLHLKTRLTSRLKTEAKLKSIIKALHPTPAVCGFPKFEAKKFIISNENYEREFYTGFLGELNLKYSKARNTNKHNVENNAYNTVKTQSNFYVNLRCMQIKNNKAFIYVGGGITKNSKVDNEWIETVNKSKTMLQVL